VVRRFNTSGTSWVDADPGGCMSLGAWIKQQTSTRSLSFSCGRSPESNVSLPPLSRVRCYVHSSAFPEPYALDLPHNRFGCTHLQIPSEGSLRPHRRVQCLSRFDAHCAQSPPLFMMETIHSAKNAAGSPASGASVDH